MGLHYDGLAIGIFAFLCIGLFHPVVMKTEYYFGKKAWPVFAAVGTIAILAAFALGGYIARACVSIFGITCLWSIHELFEQEKRVKKGWFPDGRKR